MKTLSILFSFLCFTFIMTAQDLKKEQLIETHDLAKKLKDPNSVKPVVFNVGPVDQIFSAINIGAVNTPEGMRKIQAEAAKITKDKEIVVYCGCCSSANCPNILPALDFLATAGFKKAKVLNIPTGIKEDWVQKNYPMAN